MKSTLRSFALRSTFKYLSAASLLTASTSARTFTLDQRDSIEALGERFPDFLARVTALADSYARQQAVNAFTSRLREYGRAVIEDSTVYFVYQGHALHVGVPSDLNGWSPAADTMVSLPETDLFYLAKTINSAARFEYKFAVDSTWIIDPFNRQQAMGGYGPNSEIWMPQYQPPNEIHFNPDIPHGIIDTIMVKSTILGRTHPVFVYLPPGYKKSREHYPAIYVTDGGEYLSLGLMNNVLDHLIAARRITPVVALFVDPRTDIRDSQTSMRMLDYTMSDSFVNFLVAEVQPKIRKAYRITSDPHQTAIMGASAGGLIATYAAFTRPDVFGLCAAQSASYWWNRDTMIQMVAGNPKKDIRFSIDTGTISDAQEKSRKMRDVLLEKGYSLSYHEQPEGHNWVNWRSRIDDILEYFWGTR